MFSLTLTYRLTLVRESDTEGVLDVYTYRPQCHLKN